MVDFSAYTCRGCGEIFYAKSYKEFTRGRCDACNYLRIYQISHGTAGPNLPFGLTEATASPGETGEAGTSRLPLLGTIS